MFRWPRLLTKLPFPNKPFPKASKAYLPFQAHQYFSIYQHRPNQSIMTLSFSSQYKFHAINQNGNIYKDAVSRLRILTKEQVPQYNQIVDKYILSQGTEQQLTKEESTAMLIILFEVGRYYQNKTAIKESNEEEALKHYFEGLDLAKKTGLEKSWEAAFINNAVGTIYLFKGELSKAQEYLEKGNSVTAPTIGSNTISHLSIQNLCMLSLLYEKQGNLNKAIELLLDTQTKMNAAQTDSVLPVTWIALYDHLGQRYYAKKDYKKAIDTWKKGQEIATKNLGENSYEARIFYKHLAAVLEEIQHFPEAFSYAYKYYKSNSAPFATNRDKLDSLKAIGRLYIQQKKFNEALNALNKAQEVIKSSAGQFHDDSIQIYRTMAGLYFGQNKFAEAQTAFDSAEKIILSVYGEYSPKLIENYDFAAHLFRSMQESSETSIKYFHKALDFYKRFGDREKRNIISIYILLAETFVHRQNPEGAIKYMQEALRLCTSAPEVPEKLEQVYHFLAEAYSQQEKHEEAAKNYAQAINICKANNNETDGMAYYCYHLGKTYEAMKSYVHAKNAYQRLLDYNVRTYGKDDMRTRESAEFVMNALYRLNQPEEVKKLQKEYGLKPKERLDM